MNRRFTAFTMTIWMGICVFFLLGKMDVVRAEEEKVEKLGKMDVVRAEEEQVEKLIEIPIFISDTDVFEKMERPPVQFPHEKHSIALKEDGCGICHPRDEKKKGRFVFKYPKTENKEIDEQSLMDAYHDNCIGCHEERAAEGKKAGVVTCGECHVQEKPHFEYLPIGPEHYNPLDDPYHKDCIACHGKGDESAHDADVLDWKSFYIKRKDVEKEAWPKVSLDFYLHYQHEKGLEKKCELCHHLFNKAEDKLIYLKGTESSCRDCHREKDEEKVRSFRKVAHADCINCHLERDLNNLKRGPITCNKCHGGIKQRTREEIADIPRQKREEADQSKINMEDMGDKTKATVSFGKQPEQILIKVEDARLKEVPFDHKAHEGYTFACRDCHHDTLNACKKCHTLKGIEKGGGVTLAEAYHEVSSKWSCVGCHGAEKSEKSCGGCHHLLRTGLTKSSCNICHSGPLEDNKRVAKELGDPKELLPEKLADEMEIKVMEKDYKPSKFPHFKIIKNLTDASNKSKLAKSFHSDRMSICLGCHHESPVEARQKLPLCSTCHPNRMVSKVNGIPGLMGAYHRQCLGCHKKIKQKPLECDGCHAEKSEVKTGAIK